MHKKTGILTAFAVVVANMVGTGVFTSLGFQLFDIHNGLSILTLWVLGAVMALCGALVYGSIGSRLPQSGGEYLFLSRLYHPALGFASGFVSSTVGFAAPVALAAVALGAYTTKVFPAIPSIGLALVVVMLITLIHLRSLHFGAQFQRFSTFLKMGLIVLFILAGCLIPGKGDTVFLPDAQYVHELLSPAFAVSMVYVSYAYSGWNAAAYMTEEIDQPEKNLPRALWLGTITVSILYVLLHLIFLKQVPQSDLTGVLEIGEVTAKSIFGFAMGNYMSLFISLLLVSSISAMILAGPRVTEKLCKEHNLFPVLSRHNKNGVPAGAIVFQSSLTILLIVTSGFESIMTYIGFTLSLFTSLTVAGVFFPLIQSTPSKVPLYRFPALLFLAMNAWVQYYLITSKTQESLAGLLTVIVGLVLYYLSKKRSRHAEESKRDE